jgi:hypothetical protein
MTIQIRSGSTDGALQLNGVDAITVTASTVTFPSALTILALDSSGYSADAYAYVGAGGTNASLALRTARGTSAVPSATQSGDIIGNVDYFGFGTTSAYAASIDCVATGVFTGASYPSAFNFNLTPSGSTVPSLAVTIGQGLSVYTLTPAYYAFSAIVNNNVVNGTGIQLGGARGTQTSPTAVLANDILGNIDFFGYGTTYVEGAAIDAIALSTWTATNAETALTFFKTSVNSVISNEGMRLNSNGALLVGTTTVPASGLTTFPLIGDTIVTNGGILSLSTESAGNYNFVGLGYSTANTNNASIGFKSQTRGAAATSAGDTIGNIDVFGWTGVGYGYAASIDCAAPATWTTISTPTVFNINLTLIGSITPTQAMSLSPAGLITLPQSGGIIGSNGTTSATAGVVGEFISSQVLTSAPISLTSTVTANITSIVLTAGDWDVEGIIDYIPAATTNIGLINSGTSAASATLGGQDTYCGDYYGAVIGAVIVGEVIPKIRFLITATTTVYLVANATFTVSTLTAAGRIVARRMR